MAGAGENPARSGACPNPTRGSRSTVTVCSVPRAEIRTAVRPRPIAENPRAVSRSTPPQPANRARRRHSASLSSRNGAPGSSRRLAYSTRGSPRRKARSRGTTSWDVELVAGDAATSPPATVGVQGEGTRAMPRSDRHDDRVAIAVFDDPQDTLGPLLDTHPTGVATRSAITRSAAPRSGGLSSQGNGRDKAPEDEMAVGTVGSCPQHEAGRPGSRARAHRSDPHPTVRRSMRASRPPDRGHIDGRGEDRKPRSRSVRSCRDILMMATS